jgi:MFS family permease
MGRALYHKNFRLYFYGQAISSIGNFMQRTALAWLVYRLTNSAALLGVVDFIGQSPSFFLTPFVGVFLDRWNIYRLICITQALAALQAILLGVLVFTDRIEVWHIFLLSAFIGLVNAFDNPARQTFFIHLVEGKEDLGNAIAINAASLNSARIIGPSIAGLAIAVLGEAPCFLLNGFSFLAVLISLWKMKIKTIISKKVTANVLQELKEGVIYAYSSRPIRSALILLGIGSIMGWPILILLPIFARDVLAGGPQSFGLLFSAFGVGAVVGTIYLVSRQSIKGIERIIAFAAI